MSDELFPEIERQASPIGSEEGPVRYQTVNRTQVELLPCDLEALLPPGHAARLVWRFVEGLDLSALYAGIKAREGHAGRSPIDPKILVALWLYATIDGVGSARAVDRLCVSHDAYRWLRGGVSVNYHTLSDFRVAHEASLDALLTQSIATLRHRGIVTLARVAQDGTRVRASAGVGSFRREETLQACLKDAEQLVARTKRQGDGGLARAEAAQQRAAVERLARVEDALAEMPAVAAAKTRLAKKRKGPAPVPRTSTTDPDARIMKMADGGFRPAYNIHFATDADSRAIVGVAVTTVSDDHQAFVPMVAQVHARTGADPAQWLADAGVSSKAALTEVSARGIQVVAPVPRRKGVTDPTAPCPGDSPAVRAWHQHMATPAAQTLYRQRAAVAEWVNADARRHRTLTQLCVRGLPKVRTWVLWVALAHNLVRAMGIVPHLMM